MKDEIKRIDTNTLRTNLTEYLRHNKGTTFYISKYNDLIAELKVYTKKMKLETELEIAKEAVNALEAERVLSKIE